MSTTRQPEPVPGEQRLFSQASFSEIYEQALVGPLFRPWVNPLLDDVGLRPGERVLDVACGTGIVARTARERVGATGTVVGVDLNPQMLAVARQVAPSVEWRQGDAGALPLQPGETFDVVLCQQGFQFFPDPAAAAREMHRVMVKGGRLGVSTWRPDEEFPVLHELRRIAEKHVGPIVDRRHGLGETSRLEAALSEAGFRDIRSKRSSGTIRFPDGAVFVRLNAMALVSMSANAGTLDDAARQQLVGAITRDSADVMRSTTDGAGFAFEFGTNVVLATA